MSTPISFVSQCTIKAPITCRGVGIHSGAEVTLTLNPAPTDHGIVFRRSDLSESMPIPALFPYVVGTRLGTVIGTSEDNSISTIEHLMSALQACGIDNALIDVSGPEVPVMDGSASPFLFLVDCAGIQEQDKPRRYIRIDQKITHKQPEGLTRLSPADDFEITFDIDFDAETIGKQSYTFDGNKQAYKTDIARARTFGFLHEAEQLKAVGLARGANLHNAIVIDGESVLNSSGLRYANEFVRHKVLDSYGDLYLAGYPLVGHFYGHRAGHALNVAIVKSLFSSDDNWSFLTLCKESQTFFPSTETSWRPNNSAVAGSYTKSYQ